ncbi:Aspartic peptidase [Trema orientale]|uniref:Aspartic peptidase n=1 Tax=Trema orientale TaxID=63057 RepID=A0A2P5FFU8_TREOI|nr:Aspartic peptidase [Trema orientale]
MSPPYMSYYLAFDTGSHFTWTQCEKCKEQGRSCFNQREPIFPSTKSSSYRPVLCNDQHHLCDPRRCSGVFCEYHSEYMDGSSTTGLMAWETFTLGSNSGGRGARETAQILFGCGQDQRGFLTDHPNNLMAGVMGIGWGPTSIITQLQTQANGRFSYCVPMVGNSGLVPSTYVRFGADIPSRPGFRTTKLLNYGIDPCYYINMLGISLGNQRLAIYNRVFKKNGTFGGTIVDSGSQFSVMIGPAFAAIAKGLQDYYLGTSGVRLVGMVGKWELCFTRPELLRLENMPTLSFHLEGGDLKVKPEECLRFWRDQKLQVLLFGYDEVQRCYYHRSVSADEPTFHI